MPAGDPYMQPVLAELEKRGLLLASDAALPNITTLVTGEPVKGPSWGHPQARAALDGLLDRAALRTLPEEEALARDVHVIDSDPLRVALLALGRTVAGSRR